MPKNNKKITIVAGPNGSGKTTFARVFLGKVKPNSNYLNPDVIANGLAHGNFEEASFQAGRILLTQFKESLSQKEDIAFESTLSGRTWLYFLKQAIELEYSVEIYFVFLKSIQLNRTRIKRRVLNGGHDIPNDAITRRHPRVFMNFWNEYRPLASEWIVLENSGLAPIKIMDSKQFSQLNLKEQTEFENLFLQGIPHEFSQKPEKKINQKGDEKNSKKNTAKKNRQKDPKRVTRRKGV